MHRPPAGHQGHHPGSDLVTERQSMKRSQSVHRVAVVLLTLGCLLFYGTSAQSGPIRWLQDQYRTNRTFPRVQKAYALIREGRYQEARSLLEKALTIDPENTEIRQQLLEVCFQLKDYHSALHHAEVLLEMDPDQTVNTLYLAQAAMQLDQPERVIGLLSEDRILQDFDEQYRDQAFRLLSAAYMKQEQYSRALAVLKHIRKPNYFDLYNLGASQQRLQDSDQAVAALEKAYQAADGYEAKHLVTLHLAMLHLEEDRPQEAARVLERLRNEYPAYRQERDVMEMLILVVMKLDDRAKTDDLLREYRQYYDPAPEVVETWINLLAANERYDQALALIREEVQVCQHGAQESILLEKAGRYEEAAEKLKQCAVEEKRDVPWLRIAALYNKAGRSDRELAALQEGVRRSNDPALYQSLLDRYIGLERYDDAISLLARMQQKDIGDQEELFRRQLSLYEAGHRYEQGVILLQNRLYRKKVIRKSDPDFQKLILFADHLPTAKRIELYEWLLARLDTISHFLLSNEIHLLAKTNQNKKILALLERYYPFKGLSGTQQQELMLQTASINLKLGKKKRAMEILALLKQQNIADRELAMRLSNLYAGEKDCRNALEVAKKYLRLHPLSVQFRMSAAFCYLKSGMPGLTVHSLKMVEKLDQELTPRDQRRVLLNMAYAYAGMEEPDKALAYFDRHFRLSKDPVSALKAASMAMRLQDIEKAKEFLDFIQQDALPAENVAEYYILRGDILAAEQDVQEANRYYTKALEQEKTAQHWYKWANNRRQLGDIHGAIDGLQKALEMEPENGVWLSELAYLHLAARDDGAAADEFARALKAEPDQLKLYEDFAYTRKRLLQNDQAVQLFKQVVDNAPYALVETEEDKAAQSEKLFKIRREIAEIDRRFFMQFGTSVNLQSTDTEVSSPASPIESPLNTGYGELLAGWQPPVYGYRNGRILQLFSRLLWGMESQDVWPDSDSMQLAAGARYKPFGDYNLVFSAERFIKMGSRSRNDWFLRAAGSLDRGLDWEPVRAEWPVYSIYVDGGYFLDQGTTLFSGEFRAGWSMKIDQLLNRPATFVPYGLGGFSWSNDNAGQEEQYRLDLGAGVALWHWCNESRYKAYQTKTTLGLELRVPLDSSDDADTTLLLKLTTGI